VKPVSYVTCFRKLILTEPINGSIELIPGVNISNDPDVKAQWLTPQFSIAAGAIEATHLTAESNLVFGEFDAEDMRLPPEGFLLVILAWLDMLLKNAWLLKDHAMECDAAFLRVEMDSGVSWTKNFLAIRPSFSDGYTDKNIGMSAKDLQEWGRTTDLVEGYLSEASSSPLRFMMEKGYARSGRAMQFVVAARRAQDIAFKIAHYCGALETLFTTESTELAHKLAERVAFFLGERGHNRRTVFAKVKSAYGIRSKLVHGDTLKPNQIEELPALSAECDVFLRAILREIFNSEDLKKTFDSHNGAVEDYFSRLILGPSEQ
jgi:hypothetical protein